MRIALMEVMETIQFRLAKTLMRTTIQCNEWLKEVEIGYNNTINYFQPKYTLP